MRPDARSCCIVFSAGAARPVPRGSGPASAGARDHRDADHEFDHQPRRAVVRPAVGRRDGSVGGGRRVGLSRHTRDLRSAAPVVCDRCARRRNRRTAAARSLCADTGSPPDRDRRTPARLRPAQHWRCLRPVSAGGGATGSLPRPRAAACPTARAPGGGRADDACRRAHRPRVEDGGAPLHRRGVACGRSGRANRMRSADRCGGDFRSKFHLRLML